MKQHRPSYPPSFPSTAGFPTRRNPALVYQVPSPPLASSIHLVSPKIKVLMVSLLIVSNILSIHIYILIKSYMLGVKRLREAEVMHSRVAMMATLGYIIGESTPTITYGMDVHHTIANNQIPEIPGTVLFPFFLTINIIEALRASKGWVEPGLGPLFTLRENYYPGDIGFDPLGLKPANAKEFDNMAAKELSNGRLAMLAVAGMCVQEQINGKGILETLGL